MKLSELETQFMNWCKIVLYYDLMPSPPKRFVGILEPKEMKRLMILAIDSMAENHSLELDSDPMALDGQYLELAQCEEDITLDTRTHRDELKEEHLNQHAAIGLLHAIK